MNWSKFWFIFCLIVILPGLFIAINLDFKNGTIITEIGLILLLIYLMIKKPFSKSKASKEKQ